VTGDICIRRCVAPVVGVVLLNENKTEFDGKLTQFVAGDLVYTENKPGTLCCVAVGGYPPADIAVYVGRRDVTAQLAHAHSATLTGSRGLRRIDYMVERWTHKMAASADDDGKEARCVATVAGLPANTTLAKIVVNCTFLITSPLSQDNDKKIFGHRDGGGRGGPGPDFPASNRTTHVIRAYPESFLRGIRGER